MLGLHHNPEAAYRRSEYDARIVSAQIPDLVCLCVQQVEQGLGMALRAQKNDDRSRRSAGLTQAHAALTALDMGIDPAAPLSAALRQLYGAAREAILQSVSQFDAVTLGQVRTDFSELGKVFSAQRELA